MKMKCLYTSVVRGDIVRAGHVLDLTEDECKTDVVKRFFTAVGEDAVAAPAAASLSQPARAAAAVAGLTRDQAIVKLRQAGARFRGNISNADLEVLYNQTFANLAEATTKE